MNHALPCGALSRPETEAPPMPVRDRGWLARLWLEKRAEKEKRDA
jgi:hypothetical protein